MSYLTQLTAAIAEQTTLHNATAAFRGGGAASQPESAAQRLQRLGQYFPVSLSEWLRWYAADLESISHAPEMTDNKLLAFMNDYVHNHRVKPEPAAQEKPPAASLAAPNAGQETGALSVLEKLLSEHQANLAGAGYPKRQARVSLASWRAACQRQKIPADLVNRLVQAGQVRFAHGFILAPGA